MIIEMSLEILNYLVALYIYDTIIKIKYHEEI